jgi:hypothetical protein
MKSEDDVSFQMWRHRLEDVIGRVRAEGHRPNCGILSRSFSNMWARNQTDAERAFTDSVGKTLIEMDTIVGTYEKFGAPKTASELQNRVSPTLPVPANSHTVNVYGGIHGGQLQVGDHNTQTIVNALQALKGKIDSANATPEQKQEAKGLLRSLATHPLVTSVLGGLAGGVV